MVGDYSFPHALPVVHCTDKMAVVVAPRSGSTSLEQKLGKNWLSLDEYKSTDLKRVAIIRDPYDRFKSAKRIDDLSPDLPENWWMPDFLQVIQDIQQDYILFEKYAEYNDKRAGIATKGGDRDLSEWELFSLLDEDDAYNHIINTNEELSVEEWHDLCN